jgi:hypothetical protein
MNQSYSLCDANMAFFFIFLVHYKEKSGSIELYFRNQLYSLILNHYYCGKLFDCLDQGFICLPFVSIQCSLNEECSVCSCTYVFPRVPSIHTNFLASYLFVLFERKHNIED